MKIDLASKGGVGRKLSVPPRKKSKINNVNDPILEDEWEFSDDELNTERTQALVVQI